MKGFKILTPEFTEIHFQFYWQDAPITCAAFENILPFTQTFYHARFSGQEIWIDNLTPLSILQENASIFTKPGEVVLGPEFPKRTKTANCLGVYYGEGKGIDACNIFACVVPHHAEMLNNLGMKIWKEGAMALQFLPLPNLEK
jgi:hypothetical protein